MKIWLKENRTRLFIICIVSVIGIPLLVYLLSSIPLFPIGGDNDWAGFWGGYLGAIIGAFIAIFVMKSTIDYEASVRKDNEKKYIEESATIIYWDICLFYKEVNALAVEIERIVGIPNEEDKVKQFKRFKRSAAVHISENWIRDVAKMRSLLSADEIGKVYLLYGNMIEFQKRVSGTLDGDVRDAGVINNIKNKIGVISNEINELKMRKFCPNEEYKIILNKIGKIAGMDRNNF